MSVDACPYCFSLGPCGSTCALHPVAIDAPFEHPHEHPHEEPFDESCGRCVMERYERGARAARLGELAAALVAWVGKQERMSSWHLDGCAGASDAPCECGVPEVIKAIKKSLSKGEGS